MKFTSIIFRSVLALNTLLLFLVVFSDYLLVPSWLQVFGRIHPLFLHFPIVIALIYTTLVIFAPSRVRSEKWFFPVMNGLLFTSAFTCALTALMGFFLSTDGGYDSDAIAVHQWTGVSISFTLFLILIFRDRLVQKTILYRCVAGILTLLVITTGHYGAVLTHGENFVLQPITPEIKRQPRVIEEAGIYADLIHPILEEKCNSCHNTNKAKGGLVMETAELLMKGGKNGKLWDTTAADLGLMFKRIYLPNAEKKHMPPAGKPQLTDDEIDILHRWISTGADFEKRVAELPQDDSLYLLAKLILPSAADRAYDFSAADQSVVTKLNNNNRVISPIALNSPALQVNFYNSALFTSQSLKELDAIASQIVDLNLANMPISDEDALFISRFKNLRKLNLNSTEITGKGIRSLQPLSQLESVSLAGTKADYASVRDLHQFPKLHTVYVWNTSLGSKDIQDLSRQNKKVLYQTGFSGDAIALKLTPPTLENGEQVIDSSRVVRMKHSIAGTTIKYTLNGKEPDSIGAMIFKDSIKLSSNITLKARAFKKGWLASDELSTYFFKRTFVPEKVTIRTIPDDPSKGRQIRMLFDGEKSDVNYASLKWMNFNGKSLEIFLDFGKPILCSNVTLSMLKDLSGGTFPPSDIEVYAGADNTKMSQVGKVVPRQPKTMEYREIMGIECNFREVSARVLKIIVHPVSKLPEWHQSKGDKAAVYIDEIFIN